MDPIPAVERDIALDLTRRGLLVAPVAVLAAGLLRGFDGALGAAGAVTIVLGNFCAAAFSVSWAARKSPKAAGGVALGGFVGRMAIILVAMFAVREIDAIDFPTFAVVLLATHLGLLAWEARYVSMSLGAPGLRPRPPVTPGEA